MQLTDALTVKHAMCVLQCVRRAVPRHSSQPGDFKACANNLQSLVGALASSLQLPEGLQQGLNARAQAVFDAQLPALHEVRRHVLQAARPIECRARRLLTRAPCRRLHREHRATG